jgi:electron transport complex protein RnfE
MEKKKSGRIKEIFLDGLIRQNPTFVLLLGMCSTLAVTTSLINGIGMGLSTTVVLALSNLVISLLRKVIPSKIRIASYIVVIAGFVTIIDLLLQAYIPSLSDSLGIFIPLIVVNCIILGRAEAFASKNGPIYSLVDGFSMGLGFTMALSILGAIREIIGNGTILGYTVFGSWYQPILYVIMPCGGFITLGCVIAFTQWLRNRKKGGDKA